VIGFKGRIVGEEKANGGYCSIKKKDTLENKWLGN
jgi:hypothetical protein